MKTNYDALLQLYAQNAPAHKKLKRDIACVGAVNKTDPNEVSKTLRLLRMAIFGTEGRIKYYYRYFKAETRATALNLVLDIIAGSYLENKKQTEAENLVTTAQLRAYLPLLTCAMNRQGAVD